MHETRKTSCSFVRRETGTAGQGRWLAAGPAAHRAWGARGGSGFPRCRRVPPAATRAASARLRAETAPGADSFPGVRAAGGATRPDSRRLAAAGVLSGPGPPPRTPSHRRSSRAAPGRRREQSAGAAPPRGSRC